MGGINEGRGGGGARPPNQPHLERSLTVRPLVPQPRLVFEGVEFVLCLPPVLLRHALPHELLVVLRQVLLEPRGAFHRPDGCDHEGGTASQDVDRRRRKASILT